MGNGRTRYRLFAVLGVFAFCLSMAQPVWARPNNQVSTESTPNSPEVSSEDVSEDISLPFESSSSEVSSAVSDVSSLPSVSADTTSEQSEAPTSSSEQESVTTSQTSESDEVSDSSPSSDASPTPTPSQPPIVPNRNWTEEMEATMNLASAWLSNRQADDLYYLCMTQSGQTVPAKTVNQYLVQLPARFVEQSALEQAYGILNITFCGYHAVNFLGEDAYNTFFLSDLTQTDIRTLCFSLLALDSNRYSEEDTRASYRVMLVEEILRRQQEDGSFSDQGLSDCSAQEATALSLVALAPYRAQKEVRAAAELALHRIQEWIAQPPRALHQGYDSAPAIAYTVMALTALDQSLQDAEYLIGGETLTEALLSYVRVDGGFCRQLQQESDGYATQSAVLALCSVKKSQSPFVLSNGLLEQEEAQADTLVSMEPLILFVWISIPMLGVLGWIVWSMTMRHKRILHEVADKEEPPSEQQS